MAATVTMSLDDVLVESIRLATHVVNTLVLVGARQFDRFLVAGPAGMPRVVTLPGLCHESVGAVATWIFDPASGTVTLDRHSGPVPDRVLLPEAEATPIKTTLADALSAFGKIEGASAKKPVMLMVDAGLLVADAATPHDVDFDVTRAIERFARAGGPHHLLVLRAAKTAQVPASLLGSTAVRVVHIPGATRDTRFAYATLRGQRLAQACQVETPAVARVVSDTTEDWTLQQLEALLAAAESQSVSRLHDLDELGRALRIGTAHSPWSGEQIRLSIAEARAQLSTRVLGQSAAVDAVVAALRKAVIGLASAHQSQGSQAPRAVFFFAGPTGTGKTELAKAISQLVFGQDQLLRFDCGELRQEHAVARLLGAPPGYVGYDRGGELTEGIRAKPHSVVLFDEIEKAHPRLLDVLLGVLDDGRLTSGQGDTAYFGQAVLIFTSNLGMYEERPIEIDGIPDPAGRTARVARFDYDTPFEVIERQVRDAIRDEFISGLGRPELLGRLGGAESIIVFDYLRDLDRVCRKFVTNIALSCRRLHGVDLVVDDAVVNEIVQATQSRPDALTLGGRGLKPELDRLLTNPLADFLFGQPPLKGTLWVEREADATVIRSA